MIIDTGTFSAITAEAEMLRGRARRGHRRASPGQPRPRRVSVVEQWHAAGYARAMQEILIVMNEAAEHAEASQSGRLVTAGAQADQLRAAVLSAVLAVAEAAVELYHADNVPADWVEDR